MHFLPSSFSWFDGFGPNAELILVDDGSCDGSAELCDHIAQKDSRIKVVHQKNRGPAAARNTGIDVASGDWIIFFDADDEIGDNVDGIVRDALKESDVDFHVFAFNVKVGETIETIQFPDYIFRKETDFSRYIEDEMIAKRHGNGFLWNKIYKRSVLGDQRFHADMCFLEDEVFNQEYFMKCESVACHNTPFYTYNLSSGENVRGRYDANYAKTADTVFRNFMFLLNQYNLPVSEKFVRRTAGGVHRAITEQLFHADSPLTKSEKKNILKKITESDSFIEVFRNKGRLSREMRFYLDCASRGRMNLLQNSYNLMSFLRKLK